MPRLAIAIAKASWDHQAGRRPDRIPCSLLEQLHISIGHASYFGIGCWIAESPHSQHTRRNPMIGVAESTVGGSLIPSVRTAWIKDFVRPP